MCMRGSESTLTLFKGAGESGKSTVLKQMRLIHTKGFSPSERKQWKVTIFQNLLHAFQVVFGAMEEQEVEFGEESNIVGYILRAAFCASLTAPSALPKLSRPTQTLAPTIQCL